MMRAARPSCLRAVPAGEPCSSLQAPAETFIENPATTSNTLDKAVVAPTYRDTPFSSFGG